MSKTVLVTGGAGYIGSHVVRQLGEAGYQIVVLDNLSKGFRKALTYGELVIGDSGDKALVSDLLQQYQVESVLHFAAHTVVPESVTNPLKYYGNNTCNTRNLLECCEAAGVKNFIFSSTAATYGLPDGGIASEESPTQPINAYGTSKLMSEWMLRDLAHAKPDFNYVALRYFNVAGADPSGRIGQATPDATLLIKVASEVIAGKREKMYIFGTDYNTHDGTGVRDYIHIEDLASAHLKALRYLEQGGDSQVLNCGYGHGYSVREVLDMVKSVSGQPLAVEEVARRPGDPDMLIAKADKIREVLGWEPHYDDLEQIVESALNWEAKLKQGVYEE